MQARVVLDLVAQGEIGAGVAGADGAELVAERGEGLGAPRGGERVEPDQQLAGAGADVAGGSQGFADERVCLVAGGGVMPVQGAGEGGFGVAPSSADNRGFLGTAGADPQVRGLRLARMAKTP
jgi:hypothetical protein